MNEFKGSLIHGFSRKSDLVLRFRKLLLLKWKWRWIVKVSASGGLIGSGKFKLKSVSRRPVGNKDFFCLSSKNPHLFKLIKLSQISFAQTYLLSLLPNSLKSLFLSVKWSFWWEATLRQCLAFCDSVCSWLFLTNFVFCKIQNIYVLVLPSETCWSPTQVTDDDGGF